MKQLSAWITVGGLCCLLSMAYGQPNNRLSIRPGEQLPDTVLHYVVEKSGRKTAPPALFILDFWSTSCSSCIAAFPKVDSLQNQFTESLQFILVNSHEDRAKIAKQFTLMNTRRRERGLAPLEIPGIPRIDGEGYLRSIFPHSAVPHHVWISATGKVVAITDGENTNSETITQYLKRGLIHLEEKKEFARMDTNHPLFISADLDRSQIEQYSLLIKGHAGYFRYPTVMDSNRYLVINKPVRILYESLASRLIPLLRHGYLMLEGDLASLKDPTYYTYDFIVPKKHTDSLYFHALADLNRYTNLHGQLERRKMPAFALTFSGDRQVLKTKGGAQKNTLFVREGRPAERQMCINQQWSDFIPWVSATARKTDSNRVLVDETGISGAIDLTFDQVVYDYESLRQAIRPYGFDLIEAVREVEVFVLKGNPR